MSAQDNHARRRAPWLARALRALGLVAALAPGSAMAAGCTLAVLGDSLTAGYGVALDKAFPAQLERALTAQGLGCRVLNAGVSGDTTAGGLSRLDWVLSDKPTHLLVELGANDMLRAVPPEETFANLEAIITRTQAAGIPVFVAGMLAAPNLGPDYGARFDAVFPTLAERHATGFYPFFLDEVAARPELNQPDGLHPTAAGVAVIVERITPPLLAWLRANGVGQ